MAERDNLLVAEQVVAVLKAHDLDRYLKRFLCGGERIQKCCKGATRPGRLVEMYFEAFPDLRVESQHILTQVRLTGTIKEIFWALLLRTNHSTFKGALSVKSGTAKSLVVGSILRTRSSTSNSAYSRSPKTATAG